MSRAFSLVVIILFSICASCQKQVTEDERKAQIEHEVQQRLDTERQAQEKEQLAQRESELKAREDALAANERTTPDSPPATHVTRPERRTVSVEERGTPSSYDIFYTRLEPQGSWLETSDYGYVWQPREAEHSRNWRPYANGHWVYTDAGWTWVSDETFGWATYHYGRWTRLQNVGWVWVPGDEWAPAWVSWRKSDDYVGWAPLPPEARFDRRSGIRNWADSYYDIGPTQYCFVPTAQFGARRAEQTIVPADRNVTIINQTTNVTNITYTNTTIVNEGPNYDELRSRTQQPIQRLKLERQVAFNAQTEAHLPVLKGQVIEMTAPVIERAQSVQRPRAIKQTISQPVIDHGWESISDSQTVSVRAKMRAEATPPPDAPPRTFVKPVTPAAGAPSTPASPSPTISAAGDSASSAATAVTDANSPTPEISPGSPSATPSVSPVRPPRSQTPLPTAAQTRSSTPEPTATVTPKPKSTPSAVILPRPSVSPSPSADERPRVGARFKSQALKLHPPNRVPMESPSGQATASPAASATPAITSPGESVSPSPNSSTRPYPRRKPEGLKPLPMHEAPSPSAEPSSSENASGVPVSPSPSDSRESGKEEKKKEKGQGKRERRGPAESVPTPTPTLTPIAQ
ncbi:MAG: hypothetical protein QOI34_330 [Verrucomicrobiota bacterium]